MKFCISAIDYVYQFKDHLGNIRLSYSDSDGNGDIDATTEIIEENNYYPFGLKHKGYNNVINGTDHKYGFGGKEEQDELGLGWVDITARNYDPALGRWMNLDPLAEDMRRHSPYNYAFNNPLRFTDPDGMAPDDIIIRKTRGMTDEQYEDFKTQAVADLQKLTSETLEVDSKGNVSITGCDGQDTCETGTDLISDLVNSDHVVNIIKTPYGNSTRADSKDANEKTEDEPEGTGKGDGSKVYYNPDRKSGGVNVDGTTKRPAYIALGHELLHAQDNIEGTTNRTKTNVIDPDWGETYLDKSEYKVRQSENKLRIEQNLILRRLKFKKNKQ